MTEGAKKEAILDLEDNPLTLEERTQLEEIRTKLETAQPLSALSHCTVCNGISMWHSQDGFTCGPICHSHLLEELKGDRSISGIKSRVEELEALAENLASILGDRTRKDFFPATCAEHIHKMREAIAVLIPEPPECISALSDDTKKILEDIEGALQEAKKILD